MNRSMKLAFGCHLATAFLLLGFGMIYLIRPDFMPYHAVALDMRWDELETSLQILILALMRATGGAWVGVAAAIIVLLAWPFRQGDRWAFWTIPCLGTVVSAAALYATLLVKLNTPADPPWIPASFGIILSAVGLMLSLQRPGRHL